ncbi:MAG: bifunctional precorrin-2 dehydrogenase/sirohydrochlorin ferrochelatase [Sulfuricurvum sp.]
MSFFPLFVSLEDKRVVLVGGGEVASTKLSVLLKFTKNIAIISPKISQKVADLARENNLICHQREYESGDFAFYDLVVVTANSLPLQRFIYEESRPYRVFCNFADLVDLNDFSFGSIIKRGDLVVGVSTSGSSPSYAKVIKDRIDEALGESVEEELESLATLRHSMPKGKERMEALKDASSKLITNSKKG